MTYKEKMIEEVKNIPKEIQSRMIEQHEEELNDAFNQGHQICLLKTLDLLLDTKLKDNEIIGLLQKHFDMRLNEAEDMIRTAKNRRSKNKSKGK